MENHSKYNFIKGILAGIVIAVGGCAYLTIDNLYMGAVLFAIGLFTIYSLDFYLFTGKVGFLLEDGDVVKLGTIWLGNLVGAVGMALLVMQTRMVDTTEILAHAQQYATVKIGDGLISIFILGCFCGLMMYIAAMTHRITTHTANSVGGYVGILLCVMVFLLLGFEHSVANMFYFTLAKAWSVEAIVALVVVSLGNALGALFPSLVMLPVKHLAHQ